jgi:coproporphyrinogen III oxidase-like Fe-S oxidoreductase
MLGRLHNEAEAKAALELAMRHFARVSLDLIYARPGQSEAQWRAELQRALAFGTDHLSLYQLTIEPETPFALLHRQGTLRIPDEALAANLYEITQELTEAAGRPAYEISNHALAGSESRHNLIYWRYGDYAGVGPGAHGRLMLADKRIATATMRLPERWREAVATGESSFADFVAVSDTEAAREHLLMNLRLAEGIDLAAYERRWQMRPATDKLTPLFELGLLRQEGDILSATPQGRMVLNAVIAAILN